MSDIEVSLREFFDAWTCEKLDAARVDQVIGFFAENARYSVFAWQEPFVGRDAIREEITRHAQYITDNHHEIVNVASVGNTVFVQRRDCCTMFGTAAKFEVVGVFEFDADGKITCWRDYVDSAENGAKVGQNRGDGTTAAEMREHT